MSDSSSIEKRRRWFIEVHGRPTGPYSDSDICALFREGEIPPQTIVIAEDDSSLRLQVDELDLRLKRIEFGGDDTKVGIVIPSRPDDVVRDAPVLEKPADDTESNLLEALLAAKEKKRASAAAAEGGGPSYFEEPKNPLTGNRPLLLGAAVFVGVISVWGLTSLVKKAGDLAPPAKTLPNQAGAPQDTNPVPIPPPVPPPPPSHPQAQPPGQSKLADLLKQRELDKKREQEKEKEMERQREKELEAERERDAEDRNEDVGPSGAEPFNSGERDIRAKKRGNHGPDHPGDPGAPGLDPAQGENPPEPGYEPEP